MIRQPLRLDVFAKVRIKAERDYWKKHALSKIEEGADGLLLLIFSRVHTGSTVRASTWLRLFFRCT